MTPLVQEAERILWRMVMLQSVVLAVALSATGQVPAGYVEVPRPSIVVQQPPKVTLEERPPLVIPQPPRVRVEQQPARVVEQEPLRVPVYRLPSIEVYEVQQVQPVYLGGYLLEPVPAGGRAGRERVRVRERYDYRERRSIFGR
jgi:hypothetical protein